MHEALASAIALHRRGELEQAESAYLQVLELDQDNPDALHYLGVMRCQQGKLLPAIELVRRAIGLRPDYVDALNNLGNMFLQLGSVPYAAKAYESALALEPGHPQAARNLELARSRLERLRQSAAACESALAQSPAHLGHMRSLEILYRQMGRFDEALGTLKKALSLEPDADGFYRLGELLEELGRKGEAARAYEDWLRAEPDNPVARHLLAACTLKDVPERAGDAYVTEVFDRFAESFDELLLHSLEYRAPALLGEALQRTEERPRGSLDILDAGCGTGLLAPYLRPYARHLVGVDLSPGMLRKAAGRASYDRLVVAELAGFLRGAPEAFDVVASSDTLVYFGELREVLAAARGALRPGGRLLFTLEHASAEEARAEGYRIQPHGRYSHTRPYVHATLAAAGFEVIAIESARLRREGLAQVDGLAVAARRERAS